MGPTPPAAVAVYETKAHYLDRKIAALPDYRAVYPLSTFAAIPLHSAAILDEPIRTNRAARRAGAARRRRRR